MYKSYQQVTVSTTELDVDDLTVPANATGVELQASEQHVNYTMDGSTSPTAGATGVGMRLLTTDPPKSFLIEDLRSIKFIRGAASDAKLNVHYVTGRDI